MEPTLSYLPGMMLAFGVFALNMVSPGPNILAVMGTSMGVGRRPGLALAAGVSAGSFCWAVLTAVGLSAVLAAYAQALLVIKIVGGCYLLLLAYRSLKAAASRVDPRAGGLGLGHGGSFRFFCTGLTIQMTNPKAALAWIAIMSLGMTDGAPLWVPVVLVLGLSALSLCGHCLYAIAFSTARAQSAYGRARRWIQTVLGLAFGYAGLTLLTSRS